MKSEGKDMAKSVKKSAGAHDLHIADADKRLKTICKKGIKDLFGKRPPEAVRERLAHELKVVSRNGHSSYYLLASMLAKEAERLRHASFFRGTMTGSLIAYTSGISKINPMEPEYGGVNLPFEIVREEYEGKAPALDMQCSVAFVFWVQSFLAREFPEYRYISYPLNCSQGIRSVRIYFISEESLPSEDPAGSDWYQNPDFMFLEDFFSVTMIGQNSMELVRYNSFYREGVSFVENDSEKLIPDLWKYVKTHDDSINGFKRLKVRTYDELITVLGMAHSTGVWTGLAKKMVLNGCIPLGEMIGTRDDLFLYLVKLGIDNKEAYGIMNRVRKGLHLTEDEKSKLRDIGADEWVIDLCANARYLFPRAHIAQMIRRDAFCLYGLEDAIEDGVWDHYVLQDSFIG